METSSLVGHALVKEALGLSHSSSNILFSLGHSEFGENADLVAYQLCSRSVCVRSREWLGRHACSKQNVCGGNWVAEFLLIFVVDDERV